MLAKHPNFANTQSLTPQIPKTGAMFVDFVASASSVLIHCVLLLSSFLCFTEAWPTVSPPDLNETNFEMMIKNWDTRDTGKTCKDSWDRDCGTFWVFDLDDLEDSL